MKLVIVEDSELVLYQLMRMCAEQMHEVTGVAASEDEAVNVILDHRPDAVLLDLSLATGTGLGVLKRIRSAGNQAHVLILTNHPTDFFRQRCEAHGIAGFYDKSSEAQLCFNHLAALQGSAS